MRLQNLIVTCGEATTLHHQAVQRTYAHRVYIKAHFFQIRYHRPCRRQCIIIARARIINERLDNEASRQDFIILREREAVAEAAASAAVVVVVVSVDDGVFVKLWVRGCRLFRTCLDFSLR